MVNTNPSQPEKNKDQSQFGQSQQELQIDFAKYPNNSPEFFKSLASVIISLPYHSSGTLLIDNDSYQTLRQMSIFEYSVLLPKNSTNYSELSYFESSAAGRRYIEELLEIKHLFSSSFNYQEILDVIKNSSHTEVKALARINNRRKILKKLDVMIAEQVSSYQDNNPTWDIAGQNPDIFKLNKHGQNLSRVLELVDPKHYELVIKIFNFAKNLWHSKGELFSLARFSNLSSELADHVENLIGLGSFDRDLRKLYFAFLEEDPSTAPGKLKRRSLEVEVEHNIDVYLSGDGAESSNAMQFLNDREKGCYCPIPFPSWHPRESFIHDEAREIVVRGRREAYSFSKLAVETRRTQDRAPSLLQRFCEENFSSFFYIHGSDLNMPPGRGFMASGAELEKLFFLDSDSGDSLVRYSQNAGAWLQPNFEHFENSAYVFLRGCKIVFNNHSSFQLDGVPYCRVTFNDHQNGHYGGDWLFATDVVAPLISKSRYADPEDLENRIDQIEDITQSSLTPSGLVRRSLSQQRAPLNLSWLSTLFGSCAYAYPVGSSPYFHWETPLIGTAWKDVHRHVHASYRIWDYRDSRARVDAVLKPLQDLHDQVYRVASSFQALSEIFDRRYNAWKKDLTPGIIEAPRLLREAYKWSKLRDIHKNPIILCAYNRQDPNASITPIIDCATMTMSVGGMHYQLPINSDGTENAEIMIWNKYVRPLMFAESGMRSESTYDFYFMTADNL